MNKYYDLKNLTAIVGNTYKVVIKERGFGRKFALKAKLNRKYGKEVEKDVD